MARLRGDPLLLILLGSTLFVVERIDHPGRHIAILATVDKEHRPLTLTHSLERRGLQEIPTETPATDQVCRMQNRERGQVIILLELLLELLPHAHIAAILDKAAYGGCQIGLAGEHHRRGGSHRNAVHDDLLLRPKEHWQLVDPGLYVQAVVPSHADRISATLAVVAQRGQQDVVAHAVVDPSDLQHPEGMIRISVYNYGGATGRLVGHDAIGRQWCAILGRQMLQGEVLGLTEAVAPRLEGRVVLYKILVATLGISLETGAES